MKPVRAAELLYQRANRLRRRLYRTGWLARQHLPRPVISIGNIAIGGSGKTPLTIAIARHLCSRGHRVTILSRGYGRANERQFAVVDSRDAESFGDEPVLMHQAVPQADVVVGADRAGAARWYLEHDDCDLFLLDDGFQHLQLARDIDIVIDDVGARYSREGRSALADADLLVVRDDENGPSGNKISLRPVSLVERHAELPLSDLRDSRVVAFSALARNERFFEVLEKSGAEIVARHSFRDHHRYDAEDIRAIRVSAAKSAADRIITTEKDLVKVPNEGFTALRVQMQVDPSVLQKLDLLLERLR